MDTVRFGIIGCGAIGNLHSRSLSDIAEARLVAVADASAGAARRLGERYGVDWHGDDAELLRRQDIDAVIVCVPSGLHGKIAVRAARAGKHVLVEKPMEITLRGIDEIIGECEKSGVTLGVVYNYRYKADSRALWQLMDSGALGAPILGDAYIKWYRDPSYYAPGGWRGTWAMDGGGALMNQSIHTIDMLQWCMGPVQSVFGFTGKFRHKGIEAEDTAVAALRFESGALGVIEGATSIYPGFRNRIEISGQNGTAILEDGELTSIELLDGSRPSFLPEKREQRTDSGGVSDPMDIDYNEHRRLTEDFIRSIIEKKPFWLDGHEARKAVRIILAIYESSKTGQPVRL